MVSRREVVLDFETRSRADLPKVGAYKYSLHPSTDVNCLAWAYDDEPEVYLWHPAFEERELLAWRGGKIKVQGGVPEEGREELEELLDRVSLDGILVHAHNVFFERSIWTNVCEARRGWPALDPSRLRCTAALAASYALPRKLEQVCLALGLAEQKDMAGHRLMLKMAKEAKPTKQDMLREWHEKDDELRILFDYCRGDVVAERAVLRQLRPLPDAELRTWMIDQEINWRGVHLDREMIDAALRLAEEETAAANEELEELTLGLVTKATQRAKLLAWIHDQDVDLPDLKAATVDEALACGALPDHVHQALTCRKVTSYASVKKYVAMRARLCDDDRVRDILRYHAASTGRWAGAGIQVQNFPRGGLKVCECEHMAWQHHEGWEHCTFCDCERFASSMDVACADIKDMSREALREKYGGKPRTVMELISHALRGAIVAPPGYELAVSDYSSIEAVVLFWIANEPKALAILAAGHSLYKDMAGEIFVIDDPQSMPKGTPEYQTGKAAILGLGYQMGGPKFQVTCANNGQEIDIDFARRVVGTYRRTYPRVPQLWYATEAAAMEAVRRGRGGHPVKCANTRWAVRGRFLHCRLPSGRMLSYCDPRIGYDERFDKDKLIFMGVDTYTKKWCQQDTYGGKLVENVVQATARDLMRDAMLRIDAEDPHHTFVMSVHDELVAEVREDLGNQEEFEAAMAAVPEWARGCPVSVEGWRKARYRK